MPVNGYMLFLVFNVHGLHKQIYNIPSTYTQNWIYKMHSDGSDFIWQGLILFVCEFLANVS